MALLFAVRVYDHHVPSSAYLSLAPPCVPGQSFPSFTSPQAFHHHLRRYRYLHQGTI